MTTKPHKIRLDELVLARGLAESRTQAQRLILAGQVRQGDQVLDKAGQLVSEDAEVRVAAGLPYVSRGGLKLAAALDAFGVDPAGWVCGDIGASTGGFTDCLLQRGAVRVYAVDVGYGQLAWSLRQDPRVISIERTNIRHLAVAAGAGRAGYRRRLVYRPVFGAAEYRQAVGVGRPDHRLDQAAVRGRQGPGGQGRCCARSKVARRGDREGACRGPVRWPEPVRRDPLTDHRAGR